VLAALIAPGIVALRLVAIVLRCADSATALRRSRRSSSAALLVMSLTSAKLPRRAVDAVRRFSSTWTSRPAAGGFDVVAFGLSNTAATEPSVPLL
jgi:hypothetical protein